MLLAMHVLFLVGNGASFAEVVYAQAMLDNFLLARSITKPKTYDAAEGTCVSSDHAVCAHVFRTVSRTTACGNSTLTLTRCLYKMVHNQAYKGQRYLHRGGALRTQQVKTRAGTRTEGGASCCRLFRSRIYVCFARKKNCRTREHTPHFCTQA